MTLRPDAFRLDGRVAVVTSGGAGIGRGIAEGPAAFGADVAVWERDADTAASTAAAIGGLAAVVDALVCANLGHVRRCTRRVARTMVDVGRGGSIVNVTSIERCGPHPATPPTRRRRRG